MARLELQIAWRYDDHHCFLLRKCDAYHLGFCGGGGDDGDGDDSDGDGQRLSSLEAMSLQIEVALESSPWVLYLKVAVAVQHCLGSDSVVFRLKEEDHDGGKVCVLYLGPGKSADRKTPLEELCRSAGCAAVG